MNANDFWEEFGRRHGIKRLAPESVEVYWDRLSRQLLAKEEFDMDHPMTEDFAGRLERITKNLQAEGLEREAAIVLARQLQRMLACDINNRQFPHAGSLELIMRSVLMVLEGRGMESQDYVLSKLENGVNGLFMDLKIKAAIRKDPR